MKQRLVAAIARWADESRLVPRRVWWAIAAAWYGLIFGLSAAPGLDAVSTESLLDLIALGDLNGLMRLTAHMSLFGVLAVWLYLALRPQGRASARKGFPRWAEANADDPRPARGRLPPRGLDRPSFRTAAAILLTGLFGISDEIHQHYVPARHGRALDALYDALGALLVLGVTIAAVRWARRQCGEASVRGPWPATEVTDGA